MPGFFWNSVLVSLDRKTLNCNCSKSASNYFKSSVSVNVCYIQNISCKVFPSYFKPNTWKWCEGIHCAFYFYLFWGKFYSSSSAAHAWWRFSTLSASSSHTLSLFYPSLPCTDAHPHSPNRSNPILLPLPQSQSFPEVTYVVLLLLHMYLSISNPFRACLLSTKLYRLLYERWKTILLL